MKYVICKDNKVLDILSKEPISVSSGVIVARCENVPKLSIGEYHEVFNIQEHTETYTEKEPKEVFKINEATEEEYTDIEYVEVEKERIYYTCELKVLEKPNKAQLIEERKLRNYENKIVSLIRKKYSLNEELATLRQRDSKPEEYAEYNTYVEECKAIVKNELKI